MKIDEILCIWKAILFFYKTINYKTYVKKINVFRVIDKLVCNLYVLGIINLKSKPLYCELVTKISVFYVKESCMSIRWLIRNKLQII